MTANTQTEPTTPTGDRSDRHAGATSETMSTRLRALARSGGIALVLILLVATFSVLSPVFFSFSNLTNVALQASINTILAIGLTFVIVTAGIDLSVGSTVALCAVVGGELIAGGTPFPAAIAVALAVGATAGLVNGLLVVVGGIAPFIATLGTLSAYRGLALLYTGGQPVYGLPENFRVAVAGSLFGIPAPVILTAIVAIVAAIVLRQTRLGEHALAIGGNAEAARLAGVNTKLVTATVYVMSGILAGVAAMILIARLGAAEPIAQEGAELTAIAAAVMGGASLAGGRASIIGTVLGALLIATLQSGLTLLNVQAFYQLVAIGVVIIVAVLADRAEAGRST